MAKKDDLNLGKGDGDEEAGGGKGKLIIIIVAVLVLLGGGAAAFFFLQGGEDIEGEGGEEAVEVEEPPKEPYYLDVQKLLVNIQHEGNTHYVQVEMQLMSYDQGVIEQALRDRAVIRDALLTLINAQSFDALKTVSGKEALRRAALQRANEVLETTPPNVIEAVYFDSFVMQ